MTVMSAQALERIRQVHQLSQKFNAMVGKPHQERLLELMRHHIDEIEELAAGKDAHAMVETGDLLILCYELLLENGIDIDEVTTTCFGRYERKLNQLINEHRKSMIENG